MVGSDGKEEKCVDHCEKLYVYDVRMHMLEHFWFAPIPTQWLP